MNPKQILFALLILITLSLVVAFYMNKTLVPGTPRNPEVATSTQNKPSPEVVSVSRYMAENIATLSTIQIGEGKRLSVTRMKMTNSTGTVEFTDGEKKYNADFSFTADAAGNVTVTSFKVQE